jgi:hypothetical protein
MLHEVPKKDLTHSSQYHLVNIPQNENYILSLTANKPQDASQNINNHVSFKSQLPARRSDY